MLFGLQCWCHLTELSFPKIALCPHADFQKVCRTRHWENGLQGQRDDRMYYQHDNKSSFFHSDRTNDSSLGDWCHHSGGFHCLPYHPYNTRLVFSGSHSHGYQSISDLFGILFTDYGIGSGPNSQITRSGTKGRMGFLSSLVCGNGLYGGKLFRQQVGEV